MIHYSKRLVPVPPTYERIGAGLGRPFSDLIFAKWGFNNVGWGLRCALPALVLTVARVLGALALCAAPDTHIHTIRIDRVHHNTTRAEADEMSLEKNGARRGSWRAGARGEAPCPSRGARPTAPA